MKELVRERRKEHAHKPEACEHQRGDLTCSADPMKRARGLHKTKAVRSLLRSAIHACQRRSISSRCGMVDAPTRRGSIGEDESVWM